MDLSSGENRNSEIEEEFHSQNYSMLDSSCIIMVRRTCNSFYRPAAAMKMSQNDSTNELYSIDSIDYGEMAFN